jgi:hypothetical protein
MWQLRRKTWPVRLIGYGVACAVLLFFSLSPELDTTVAKVTHSSIAKVKKELRSRGDRPALAVTINSAFLLPNFHAAFIKAGEFEKFFDRPAIDSRHIRAPPW